jgi:hypothetical protein
MIHQLTYLQPHPYCQKPLQTCFGLLRVLLPCISMDRLPTAFPDAPGVPDGPDALRLSSPTVPHCSSSTSGSRPTTSTDPDPQDDLSRAQNSQQEQLLIAGAGAPCGPPPPPATYATFAEADEAIKAHALSNG